ncbi:hypothetical protein Lalb_Chr02g0156161 [Lupinus albus]|uniref:Uncharacterized protein n=1 Tax=Lupinus albus TaxID=3870 RepID=A0A6A4R0Z3_LUPAL|nr:hypothetical protein Lalb_Chr02g0156161 [Lupinus albus]
MAKGIRNLSSWMECAPAPIIFPKKPSNRQVWKPSLKKLLRILIIISYINSLVTKVANIVKMNYIIHIHFNKNSKIQFELVHWKLE